MAAKRTRPHFIGIGVPYANTGMIMRLLAAHPEIADTIPSLHFFNTEAYTKKGVAWYEAQFPYPAHQITGECSPEYLSHASVPSRVVRHFPDTKLIVVLRNPIQRAIAHFEQWKRSPKNKHFASCAQLMNAHKEVQLLGLYGQQLDEFYAFYSPLQIHIVIYEDFAASPLKVTQEIYEFLGVKSDVVVPDLRQYAPPPDEPRHKSLLYRAKKGIGRLKKRIYHPAPTKVTLPEYDPKRYFSPENLAILQSFYLPDIDRLSRLMHRDMGVFWGCKEEK